MKNLQQSVDLRSALSKIDQKLAREKNSHLPDIQTIIFIAQEKIGKLLEKSDLIRLPDIQVLLVEIKQLAEEILSYQLETMEMGKNTIQEMMAPFADLQELDPGSKPIPIPQTFISTSHESWRDGIEL